jgi:ribosomal protein L11 methyltransferase
VNYYKLTFKNLTQELTPEILTAFLANYGYESFEENDDKLIAYIQESLFREDDLKEIKILGPYMRDNKVDKEFIPDKNWNAVWESNYNPVLIENCFIRAPFHKPNPDAEYNILLDVKMAFGTAHHETTSLMIEYVLENEFEVDRVLDMGSGTAVLAILASMKGAGKLYAIDNDEWAYNNAIENAKLNNINNIEAVLGDATNLDCLESFDVIFANINKNILLRDIRYYSKVLLSDGHIYFSGFYTEDLNDIKAECNNNSLEYVSYKTKNNWVAAEFIKV